MCLVNRRGLGTAKHVEVQNLWIQEASKAGQFVTKKVGANVNPADLMTKPVPRPKIETIAETDGLTIRGAAPGASSVTLYMTGEVTATCRVRFDHCVFAGGCCAESGTNYWKGHICCRSV